ncbi:hypothetical protein BDQ17DRAFT_1099690 [Cyathus striatus]|nr:hypothetical protein BDQ17DRAFT_1099690 [Cyathus striatus]
MPSSMNMAFLAIPVPQAQVSSMNGAVNGAKEGEEGRSVALLKSRFSSSPAPIPPQRTSSPSPRPYRVDSSTSTTPTKLNPLTCPVPPPTPSNSGYLHGATNNNNLSTSTSPQPSGLSKLASSSLVSLGRDTPPPSGQGQGVHSRTPSISISTSSSSTSAASISTTTHTPPSKPAIPPRPPKPDTPLGQLQDPILPVSHTSQSPEHIPSSSPIPVERSSITMPDNAPPIPARGAFKSGGGGEDSPQSASGSGSEGRLFPPPPRHHASLTPGVMESITSNTPAQPLATPSSLPTSKPAPPLPIRRSTVANTEDRRPALHKLVSPPAPPAPPAFDTNPITPVSYPASNPHSISSHTHNILSHILPHSHTPPPLHDAQHPHPQPQRKHLSRLPPPPTRTIGPGDKLPPARRPTSPSSDDDSGADEEDPRASAVEHMPDATRSNRRGPILSFRNGDAHLSKIQLHPYNGTLAVSGASLVLGQGHTLGIYDLSLGGIVRFM